MIIKAYAGDGSWNLYEGTDVEYLGPQNYVHVSFPDGREDGGYSTDERFPTTGDDVLHIIHSGAVLADSHATDGPYRLMRWVKWFDHRDRTRRTVLITDGPVFICNDRGDTVESIR
jgi:hypothetical protein